MRSLEADGFRGVTLAFLIAGALLAAWAAWFVLGRVAVYEVTDRARLEVNQAVNPIDARVQGRVVATHLVLGRAVEEGDVFVELDADEQRLRLEEEQTRYAALSPRLNAVTAAMAAEERALDAAGCTARVALEEARSQLRGGRSARSARSGRGGAERATARRRPCPRDRRAAGARRSAATARRGR